MEHGAPTAANMERGTGFFAAYNRIPLFVRILAALVLGMIVGLKMGTDAGVFRPISDIVLQILRLLATPLIFVAVLNAIYKANATGKAAGRLLALLMTNTVVAILVGLLVANVIQPGRLVHLSPAGAAAPRKPVNFLQDLLEKVPSNLIDPLQRNEIISIIILAVAFGVAMRIVREQQAKQGKTGCETIGDVFDTVFQLVMVMLHWVFALIPLAVFAVVARQVGKDGIKPLAQMLWFVITVVAALGIQAVYYVLRVRFGSWVRPVQFLRGASEALITAFSTASSAATLPITYTCVKDKIGVREESASLGVMVGGTFNHDGTALYEAMAALFVGQMLGYHLGLWQQVSVVIMSVFASVGAAGIPEAGTVTMIAVFTAVKLPTEYIPLLLPLDWFLDRCRTAINVMGDMSVTCLLDGKTAHAAHKQQEQSAFVESATGTENVPDGEASPNVVGT